MLVCAGAPAGRCCACRNDGTGAALAAARRNNFAAAGVGRHRHIDATGRDRCCDERRHRRRRGGGDQGTGVNRTLPGAKTGKGKPISPNARPKSRPSLNLSFEALNFFNQRFANGGNQFSVEPPDQALCVGNGFVVEAVNDVLRVYSASGTPADRRRRPQHVLRLPAGDRPHGPECGQRGPFDHRPDVHLRSGHRALRARRPDARPRRDRRLR